MLWLTLKSKAFTATGEAEVSMNQSKEAGRVYIELKEGEKKTGFTVPTKELIAFLNVIKETE